MKTGLILEKNPKGIHIYFLKLFSDRVARGDSPPLLNYWTLINLSNN